MGWAQIGPNQHENNHQNLFTQQQDKVITKSFKMGGYKIGIIPKLIYNLNEMIIFINNNEIKPTC